jgi:hypothetical protein
MQQSKGKPNNSMAALRRWKVEIIDFSPHPVELFDFCTRLKNRLPQTD